MLKILCLFVLSIGLLACDQKSSIDSTKERARAEGEAGGEVERKNLAERAQKMEADLALRHYYYNAVEGEYEGTVKVGSESYKMKLTFARSIPPYMGNRVRELGEIEADLNNLYFNVQAVQWHPSSTSSATGCRISGIRPNMSDGTLFAASSDCQNLYTVMLSETGTSPSRGRGENAKSMAAKVQAMKLSQVEYLVGDIQPSSIAAKYTFSLKKVK